MHLRPLVLLAILSLNSHAQRDSATLEKNLSFRYDNDFFAATDRYYTQGVFLSCVHPVIARSPSSYLLARLKDPDKAFDRITLEQEVYTPRSIRYNEGNIYYGERPFTAFFLLSHTKQTTQLAKKISLRSQLDLGFMGPSALGEQEQKGIHKALNNIEPLGWENQLSDDIIVNYRVSLSKVIVQSKFLQVMGDLTARAGSLFTDAGIGMRMRIGDAGVFPFYNSSPYKNKGVRIFFSPAVSARAVAYNATLQGGLFNRNNIYTLSSDELSRLIFQASASVAISYYKVCIGFSRSYISKEFANGLDHGWGSCMITYSF
jgi:lipid A 3-O-deacylase